MISRKYKLIYDCANCIMIYLLGLAIAIGATAFMKGTSFPWVYAIGSAIVLAGCVFMRLYIGQLIISVITHGIVIVAVWFAFVSNAKDKFPGILLLAFAGILAAVDLFTDFYKKKNQSYGEIHVFSCILFLPVYAYVDWVAKKLSTSTDAAETVLGSKCNIYGTLICVLCILFFGLTLIRAYMKNAIKLADNSQIDENAPVTYMYGNSNKFIGPIIAFIIAIMLVIQSKTSSNIFASIWFGLLQGVAGVCNLFSFVRSSDQTEFISGTQIAPEGTTLFWVEVVIAGIIILAIVIALIVIISKIYKSHWHKDISLDETLESAAMVEKREWIYHKTSTRKLSEDTSVTKAAEIPADISKTDTVVEEVKEETVEAVEEVKEEAVETAEEVKEEVVAEAEEVKEEVAAEVEEVKEKAADSVKDGVTHGKKPSGNKSKKKK